MVCIDLNGWLVQNKLSLPDEAPEQFNTNYLVGVYGDNAAMQNNLQISKKGEKGLE